MADLHQCNDHRSDPSLAQDRRPSIYAAFNLARLVHSFVSRVKSCISARRSSTKGLLNAPIQGVNFPAYPGQRRHPAYPKSARSNSDWHWPSGRSLASECSTIELLRELDSNTQRQRTSTAIIATDDKLFLQYNAQRTLATKGVRELGNVLDLTTLLLSRLRQLSGQCCASSQRIFQDVVSSVNLPFERCLANLEHIMRCLQQAAYEGLIQRSLKRLEGELVAWYKCWKQRRHTSLSWFTEWPSGRRPLSTTWPWNIKPSLVVLWGVCWMFYVEGEATRNSGGTHSQADRFPDISLTTRQPPQPSVPPYPHNEAWTANAFPFNAPTIPVWPGSQVESHPLYASHANERETRITDYYTLPASTVSVSSTPYISTSPSTSSASFVTPTEFPPHYQGNNGTATFTSNPVLDFHINQLSPYESLPVPNIVDPHTDTASTLQPYVPQPIHALPYEDPRRFGRLGVGSRFSGHGSANSLGLVASNMPDYPSPRSEMSSHSRSPSVSLYPTADTSPFAVPHTTIPASRKTSYGSPQSIKSEEPSRNEEGEIYCTHNDCLANPPTFARKCEWTKHMDKHNRPYVCEEPGCEKILGFTYSGGLSRHQREVHKKYGGAKASCLCPHKYCKRSTGPPFSRRENLVEHIRRVHQGVEEEGGEAISTTTSTSPQGRKRKREPSHQLEEDKEPSDSEPSKRQKPSAPTEESHEEASTKPEADTGDSEDLRAQVKSLQLELQRKDERLRKLEEIVARLAGK